LARAPLLLHFVAFVTGAAAVHPAAPAVETAAEAQNVAVVARACEVAVVAPKITAPLKVHGADVQKDLADAPAPVKKTPKAKPVVAVVARAAFADVATPVIAPRREPGEPRGPPAA
jgi:hypothetical protein